MVFAVNCGGTQYTDSQDVIYAADTNFSGGRVRTLQQDVDGGEIPSVPDITGTEDDVLYETERCDDLDHNGFSYSFNLADGTYRATLKFAELWFTEAEKRKFDVKHIIQNIDDLDLFAEVGQYAAYDWVDRFGFGHTPPSSQVHTWTFSSEPGFDCAQICAILIEKKVE